MKEIEKWCNCRIVKPKYAQVDDCLFCQNCRATKKLPPKISLEWERQKREFKKMGEVHYAQYHKDYLIELLIRKDMDFLEEWRQKGRFWKTDSWIEKFNKTIEYLQLKQEEE